MECHIYCYHCLIQFFNVLLFSEGQREAVAVLYRELYDQGHITHWAVSSPRRGLRNTLMSIKHANYPAKIRDLDPMTLHGDIVGDEPVAPVLTQQPELKNLKKQLVSGRELLMDLHGFSRGMAYAALHVAIEEV